MKARKMKIDVGQNWLVMAAGDLYTNHLFQIVARISDGGWMYNHRRANRYYFVAVKYGGAMETAVFDEYGYEVGGTRLLLINKSRSKLTYLKEVSW